MKNYKQWPAIFFVVSAITALNANATSMQLTINGRIASKQTNFDTGLDSFWGLSGSRTAHAGDPVTIKFNFDSSIFDDYPTQKQFGGVGSVNSSINYNGVTRTFSSEKKWSSQTNSLLFWEVDGKNESTGIFTSNLSGNVDFMTQISPFLTDVSMGRSGIYNLGSNTRFRLVYEEKSASQTKFQSNMVVDVANGASATIAPVPEPETWAMLLAGLTLVGLAAKRRSS